MYSVDKIVSLKLQNVNDVREHVITYFNKFTIDYKIEYDLSKEDIEQNLSNLFDEVIVEIKNKKNMFDEVIEKINDEKTKQELNDKFIIFITNYDTELYIIAEYLDYEWYELYNILKDSFNLFFIKNRNVINEMKIEDEEINKSLSMIF